MSEEESFVILGSSPLPSICSDGNSLLRDALDRENDTQAAESKGPPSSTLEQTQASSDIMCHQNGNAEPSKVNGEINSTSVHTNNSGEGSLAASFILGEVNADVLKNSVYSQFPSLCSMQACAEDVVKLQNMMTEYVALKQTLDKVNHTMQDYYKITQQWRQDSATQEKKYQEQLQQCQAQMEKLTAENIQLKADMEANLEQMRLIEDIRQKEHDELRQCVSEKTSLINNMRVEIDKLSHQQLQSYEVVPEEGKKELKSNCDFIKREDHERLTKDLQREMSRLLAENLEVKDMQKTYIDEITCLKVNLTSTEELLNQTRADIGILNAKDLQKQDEIAHLQTQVESYRRDFELERADREKNAGEKEQYLQDLRALQRRNQELIEALTDTQKTSSGATSSTSSIRDNQRPVLDPTGAAARVSDEVLRCPICSKGFKSLSVLQSHVNDCLDKS